MLTALRYKVGGSVKSTTININEGSTDYDSGWNVQPAAVNCQYKSFTQHIIKKVTIQGASSIVAEGETWVGSISIVVNSITVFTGSFNATRDDTDKHPYSVNCNVSIDFGDTVGIYATGGTGSSTKLYYGNTTQHIVTGQITNNTACAEMLINVDYSPIWLFDGQNENYPHPIDTTADAFTEFAKDDFGYPTNWGVWKLDDQNDGYPWMTGYEDFIVKGLPVKIMSQDKTHWVNVWLGVFTTEKILNAYINLIKGDAANAINSE